MEEEKFNILVDVLKIMDNDGIKKMSVSQGLKDVIEHFDSSFTGEQKNEIVKELRGYGIKKRDAEELKKIRTRLDEERYRNMLENFFNANIGGF